MGKQITFINARVIDPKAEIETSGAFTVNDGLIEKRDGGIEGKVIDCEGMCLAPGIVDIGVKICEPGEKHKEVSDLLATRQQLGCHKFSHSPDTKPSIDTPEL